MALPVDAEIKMKTLNRARAEERVKTCGTNNIPSLSPDQINALIHELETHSIELEWQNEELKFSKEALKEIQQQYTELYDKAPIAYISTNKDGFIVKSNIAFERTES